MTSFEERLARLKTTETEYLDDVIVGEPGRKPVQSPIGRLLRRLCVLVFGLAFGAAAVVSGRLVQILVIDGGPTPGAAIPPDPGYAALGAALVLSYLFGRVFRGGKTGPLAVTAGFIAMMTQETRLAAAYPELWTQIYEAKYLLPVMEMAGL